MKEGKVFCFHHGWHFLLADEFPMQKALEKHKDKTDAVFMNFDYIEENWESVTLPHTFNDTDLFRDRIKDAGSGQKRTAAFYRNYLTVPKEYCGQKVLIEFEGIRQTCYLYVNGKMVGYVENGVAPFGFDLTPFIDYDKPNLIAVAMTTPPRVKRIFALQKHRTSLTLYPVRTCFRRTKRSIKCVRVWDISGIAMTSIRLLAV